jgi:hypothetical protein
LRHDRVDGRDKPGHDAKSRRPEICPRFDASRDPRRSASQTGGRQRHARVAPANDSRKAATFPGSKSV